MPSMMSSSSSPSSQSSPSRSSAWPSPLAALSAGLVGLSLAASGCATEEPPLYDRDGARNCPEDELCAPETPRGLRFNMGREWFDTNPIIPIAAGGEANIYFEATNTQQALQTPWQASVTGPFELREQASSHVRLKGLAAGANVGEGVLRIANLDDYLLDRVAIKVAAIHSIRISFLDTPPEPQLPTRPLALFGGAAFRFVKVSLRDVEGNELADHAMQLKVLSGGSLSHDGLINPAQTFTADPSASLVRLEVKAGGTSHFFEVPIAQQIDRLDPSPVPSVLRDPKLVLCFQAVSDERRVTGMMWDFTSSPNVMVSSSSGTSGCITVTASSDSNGDSNGDAWVTAKAGDVTQTVTFRVEIPPVASASASSSVSASAAGYSSSPVQ